MAFCTNCGQQVTDGAKFCANCGTPISQNAPNTERKTVFDGEIHKCPHCGEVLKAFETVCPMCKFEIRGAKGSNAVKELAEKLENASSEKQRIIIIKNFPIPNTKEDIFEFMLLASSNFDVSYYATHLHEEDISDAWLTKIEQCYQKAKLAFGSHSDFERIESIYLEIKNECAEKENKIKHEQKAQQSAKERAEVATLFKKSKLRIVTIIFAIISALCIAVAFNDGRTVAGVIAIIMFALLVLVFLMGSGVIKEKVKNIRLIPLILAFVLFIPYFSTYNGDGDIIPNIKRYETISWDELILGSMLPTPDSLKGKVVFDSEKELDLDLADATKSTFTSYVQSCKDKGFTIDVLQEKDSFRAFNEEGYRVKLFYSDYYDELSINLIDPIKRNTINWSAVPLMTDVPTPPSSTGEFGNNYDWTVTIYLVDVTRTQYDDYINKCIEEGFSIDMSRYDNTFYGDNKDGLELQISWEGNNTISIHITNLELL